MAEKDIETEIEIMVTPCWVWSRSTSSTGYGNLNRAGHVKNAHKVSYECFRGTVPKGLQLDHLCRQKLCVNPWHLEVVTNKENGRRGIKGILTTHCPQGHFYSHINTRVRPNGWRSCRICDNKGRK